MQEKRGSQACTPASGRTSTEARTAPGVASDKCPSGARRPRKTRDGHFTTRIQHLKGLALQQANRGEDYAYYAPRIGPGLTLACVPDRGQPQAEPLGLSPVPNSPEEALPGTSIEDGSKAAVGRRPARNGLKGISSKGLRNVKDTLICLDDVSSKLAFITYSLPDEDYVHFLQGARWEVFQRKTIDLWAQYLKSEGAPAIVLQVAEIGGRRLNRVDQPMPHLHLVVYGWNQKRRDGAFLINKQINEEILARACAYAGLPSRKRQAACNVQQVKFSVKGYLSKYLTKEGPKGGVAFKPEHEGCVPRQWWNRSADLKAFVDGHYFKLPPAFCAFVVREQKRLERVGVGRAFVVQGAPYAYFGSTKHYEITAFHFFSPEHVAWFIEMYGAWRSNPNHWGREVDRWLDERDVSRDNSTIVPLPNLHPTNYRHHFWLDTFFDLTE